MSNLIDNIKNWLLLLLTIIVIILTVHTCTQKPCGADGEVISSTTTIDSVRTHMEHYKDSIDEWILHAYVEVPEITPESNPVFFNNIPNTPEPILNTSEDTLDNSSIYYYGKQDSSLKYNIRVTGPCKPDKVEVEYLILEKTIKDSVYVRDSVHVKQVDKVRVNQLYYGVEAIVYPNLQAMFIGVDWIHKKGWQVEAGIGFDITNKAVIGKVGVKKLLTFRKKK